MATLLERLRGGRPEVSAGLRVVSDGPSGSWLSQVGTVGRHETVPVDWDLHAGQLLRSDPVLFAAVAVRAQVFAEARFVFRRFEQGAPQPPFTTEALGLVERPAPGWSTGELLTAMEVDGSLAGNAFFAKVSDGAGGLMLQRLRPDLVTIVTGLPGDPVDTAWLPGARTLGYVYHPPHGAKVTFHPSYVVHYRPMPDPSAASGRGMSWVGAVLDDIYADRSATRHKVGFFRRGAVPGLAISYDKSLSREQVQEYVDMFRDEFDGVGNAFRTLHLGGGADPKVVGADLRQLDLKATQGQSETRIAMAAQVPTVILGASEGQEGSALNAGNYTAIRRRFADGTIRPLWRHASAALSSVVDVPEGAELHADDRACSFMQEDLKDEADIRREVAATVNALIMQGWTPESAVAYAGSGDVRQLVHTGLLSVQLQPPDPDGPVIEGEDDDG